jgi:hypothetical protein
VAAKIIIPLRELLDALVPWELAPQSERSAVGSSREYWLYAGECARRAAKAKEEEDDKDILLQVAKAWTNIALVEENVAKRAQHDLFEREATEARLSFWSKGYVTFSDLRIFRKQHHQHAYR